MMPKMSNRTGAARCFMAVVILMLATAIAVAQSGQVSQYDHGTPPQHAAGVSGIGSYISSDLGTINLSNGSLNFKIPLGAVGGRGFYLPLTLNYTSKVWSATTGSAAVSDPTPHTEATAIAVYDDPAQADDFFMKLGAGWTVGAAPYIKARGLGISPVQNPNGCSEFNWILVKLTVVLPDKGEIELRDDQLDGAPHSAQTFPSTGCRTQDAYRGRRWHASDGSGAVFYSDVDNGVVNGNVAGVLITADGMRYHFINAGGGGNLGGSAYLKSLGRCDLITDRNGNQIQIAYAAHTVTYTDQLGRHTTLRVNDPQQAPVVLTVTMPGYNGAARVYTVRTDTMNLHYRSVINPINPATPVINGDDDPLGYGYGWPGSPTRLYPSSYGSGATRLDNLPVVSRLVLPDGRALNFSYNEFGEVADVQFVATDLATVLNRVQYDYLSVIGDGPNGIGLPAGNTLSCEAQPLSQQIHSNVKAIDRAVVTRRTYPNGSTLEATWTYGYKVDKTEVQCRSAASVLLLDQWHYYMSSQRFLDCVHGAPDGTGYSIWSTGLERRSERRASDAMTVLAANEQDWSQRAPIGWPTCSGCFAAQQIANENRINEERKYLDDGSYSKVVTTYDDTVSLLPNHINNPVQIDEYDFDHVTLKRRTTTSYKSGGRYTSTAANTINLLSLPETQSVFEGSDLNNPKASMTYEYDIYTADPPANNHAALESYQGAAITGHDTSYGMSKVERGNVTQITRMVDGSTSTNSYTQYDVAGNGIWMRDPNTKVTTISFVDDFGLGAAPGAGSSGTFGATYAMPTLITSPPPNPNETAHTARSQYDFSTGLLTGFKDRNGQITQSFYNDPFDRPTQIRAALATGAENHTAMYYAPQTTPYGIVLTNNDVLTAKDQTGLDDGHLRSWTKTDGFGRAIQSFTHDDDAGGDVRVDTTYDGLSRAKRVTNPYRSTSDPTYGYADTTYDLLGRVMRVESFTGSGTTTGVVNTAYSGPRVLVTDQAGKQRLSKTDGLGRLIEVWEVTPSDGATEALTFPGHPEVAAGYRTSYGYDGLDDLKQVTQRIGTSGTTQTRSFSYDGLKRLTQAINPESGTVSYQYDGNGNLTQKVDGRGITTTYDYDALNRLKSRSYTNDPQNTPAVYYKYDAQSLPAGAPSYTRTYTTGRLVAVTYGTGSSVGSYSNYDALGRVILSYQQTDGQNYQCGYSYNLASAMTSESYPSGRVVATEYDAAGRVAGVKNAATGAYWAGAAASDATNRMQYAAHGAVSVMKLGNAKWEHTTYNTRLQPTQIGLGTTSTDSSLLKLDYAYGTTSNNGNLLSQTITIGATVISQSYGYDALNRLQSATETSAWSQTYGYDRFGNRAVTSSSGYPLSPLTPTSLAAYNPSSNRLNANGYDNSGNQTQEGVSRTFTYDAENRQLTFNTTAGQYAYDGDGRRVKKIDSTGTTVFVYDTGGRMIAEYTSGSATGSGTSYLTSDHLGSTRLVTKADGSVKARYDYLPFGEELGAGVGQRTVGMGYSASDTTRQKFTSKERDNESGLDYFINRYYSSAQGRFTSVDPFDPILGKQGAENLEQAEKELRSYLRQPQHWNRYIYAQNCPMKYVDPDGMDPIIVNLHIVWDKRSNYSAAEKQKILDTYVWKAKKDFGKIDVQFNVTQTDGTASNLDTKARVIDPSSKMTGAINAFFTKSESLPSSEVTDYSSGSIFISTGSVSDEGDLTHGIIHAAGIAAGFNGYPSIPQGAGPILGGLYDYTRTNSAEAKVISIKAYLEGDPQLFYGYGTAKAGLPPTSTARHTNGDLQVLKTGLQKYAYKPTW